MPVGDRRVVDVVGHLIVRLHNCLVWSITEIKYAYYFVKPYVTNDLSCAFTLVHSYLIVAFQGHSLSVY